MGAELEEMEVSWGELKAVSSVRAATQPSFRKLFFCLRPCYK